MTKFWYLFYFSFYVSIRLTEFLIAQFFFKIFKPYKDPFAPKTDGDDEKDF